MTASGLPVLAARIGAFTFHGASAPALREIGLVAVSGTLTAVLGGSGSGKTALGKVLAGWLRAGQAGSLNGSLQLGETRLEFVGGEDDPRIDPEAWSRRVGYVPQDAAAILSSVRSTVAEELAFGLENRGMAREQMHSEVARTAELTGLTALLGRDPGTLSGGELRRLAVGCAVISQPEVLVLDEPLASLDAAGAAQIVELLRGLLDAGTAVVLLSQAADGLALGAAHWVVLDRGTVSARGTPAHLERSPELAGSGVVTTDMSSPAPRRRNMSSRTPGSAAVLELRDIGFGYGSAGIPARRSASRPAGRSAGNPPRPAVLRGLELAVRPGEIVAVTGPNGAGKSTLLRHFNGLLRPESGEVLVAGRGIAGIPAGRVSASVGLLFQQPRDQLFERTVLREVSFGLRRLIGAEAAGIRARAALAAVGLSGAAEAHPAELPASQQRLLALATVLAREPAVLALDEPTVGLDRHGLARLRAAIDSAAARGAGVVLVTHDLEYAQAHAHRTLELRDGRLREL
ncbi:putative HMP/thiamine import ATP-binding protein YkoD [Arthrobacter sp. SO5]|uniref:ABC transporter ATP-binding protein n=1 Tax=Arthrobacter sp. SO5 TaxID=1897055 RepID=UPI001E487298|nr:ABC transporter ATP-binding protein [Arthrobacter sp. SO5]MCB5275168.1 putative HMP/thiamine import ATP-binding protein YkoD [Arthrobacter sp. SO5]